MSAIAKHLVGVGLTSLVRTRPAVARPRITLTRILLAAAVLGGIALVARHNARAEVMQIRSSEMHPVLVIQNTRASIANGIIEVQGLSINLGKKAFSNPVVEVQLVNAGGRVLLTEPAVLPGQLKPGSQRLFDVITSVPQGLAGYRVLFCNVAGDEIPSR